MTISCASLAGDHTGEATPDPIPNSEVKLPRADGTCSARNWESRSLPALFFVCRRGGAGRSLSPSWPTYPERGRRPSRGMVLIPQGIGRVGSRRAFPFVAGCVTGSLGGPLGPPQRGGPSLDGFSRSCSLRSHTMPARKSAHPPRFPRHRPLGEKPGDIGEKGRGADGE